jgi:enoyl-CoA hydratase
VERNKPPDASSRSRRLESKKEENPMPEGQVVFRREGQIGEIEFDNQGSLNAMSFGMWRQLGTICANISQDPSLRVVVLRGAGGKAFVSGTEIDEFLTFEDGKRGIAYEAEMDGYAAAVERLPQITIAAVQGWAVGGGLNLAFACDLRVATPESKFGAPLGRSIGNCLSASAYARLAAHAGISPAKRMILLGEMIGAGELLALGAVHKVVAPEDLDQAVADMALRAAENAPITSQVTKTALWRLIYANLPDIDDLTERAYGSEDFRHGVRSFVAKKKTRNWTGA